MKKLTTVALCCLLSMTNVFAQTESINDQKAKATKDKVEAPEIKNVHPRERIDTRLSITGDELRRAGNRNVIQALKNIDPTFMVPDNLVVGSDPNAIPRSHIYAQTGLSNVQPLFIVDGFKVPVYRALLLDLNAIDRVVVLKDAAGKSRYGAEGGQGVVEIYTIRPGAGKINVRYNGNVDIQSADLSSYNLCSTHEKLLGEMLAGYGDYEVGEDGIITPQDTRYIDLIKKADDGLYTDWLSLPLRESVSHRHSLYVDGNIKRFSYGVNLYYNNTEGVMKGSDKRIVDGNLFLSYRFGNVLVTNQFGYNDNLGHLSPYGKLSDYARMNPYFSPYDAGGNLVKSFEDGDFSQPNPLWNKMTDVKSKCKGSNINELLKAEWYINSRFTARAAFRYEKQKFNIWEFKPADHSDFFGNETDARGSYIKYVDNREDLGTELGMDYNIQWGVGNNLTASLVANYDRSNNDILSLKEFGMTTNNPEIAVEAPLPISSDITSEIWRVNAIVNYSYQDKYLFYANYCLQNSSLTSMKSRTNGYWSLGACWALAREWDLSGWMDEFNIRLSTGSVGGYNESMTDKIQWQKRHDWNVGADFSLLKGFVSGRFIYFAASADRVGVQENIIVNDNMEWLGMEAETESKGYEAALNINVLNADRYHLNLFATVTAFKNKIKNVAVHTRDMDMDLTGEAKMPLDALLVKASAGIDPATGKEIFVAADESYTFEYDRAAYVDCGDMMPKNAGTFGLNGEFWGVGVNAVFAWDRGSMMFNNTLADRCDNADEHYNFDRRLIEYGRWNKAGDISPFKSNSNIGEKNYTTRFVQKINRFSIPYLSVYYDLKHAGLLDNSFLNECKLSFSMNDIYTRSQKKAKQYERGTEYPFSKTYSISLLLSF